MKQFVVIFLIVSGVSIQAGAQSFLNELKNKHSGEGIVTVTQSPEIDELVNNAKLIKTEPQTPKNRTAETQATTRHEQPLNSEQAKTTPADSGKKENAHYGTTHDTAEYTSTNATKKIMLNSRKVTGYRIQLYSGGNSREDRQRAESIRNTAKQKFPDIPVYVHFYSPRWICRAGNFRTYQEASNMLKEFKSLGYRQACIVKGKITVGY